MENLENKINYCFKNKELLKQSLTHPSMQNTSQNYERLEFLGDGVLNLIISEYLMKNDTTCSEGDLAGKRAYLISGLVIAEIAQSLELGRCLSFAKSEINSGGEKNLNNLENALEALIGAVFMDSSYENAKEMVLNLWKDHLQRDVSKQESNPKSFLQEWSSEQNYGHPKYIVLDHSGPDHSRIFLVQVAIDGFGLAKAEGASIKKAEIEAAKMLIKKIESN